LTEIVQTAAISVQAHTFCEFKIPFPPSSSHLNWFKSSRSDTLANLTLPPSESTALQLFYSDSSLLPSIVTILT